MNNNGVLKVKNKKLNQGENATGWGFVLPYFASFFLFITIPVILGILLSFTYFDLINTPKFIGLNNFVNLFTADDVFMQQVLPNTLKFALIVGPVGYMLSFLLAWLLAQIPQKPRTVLALLIYSPSMTAGIAMAVMWRIIFSGDSSGYLNSVLLSLNLIDSPIQWLQDPKYLLNIMIIVSLWSSMGIGFLAMLAGVLNINEELYEAAYVDGMSNKFQEIFYITIPTMKPQMLFGAIMSLVATFNAGAIGVQLTGVNPTPQNAGQLIVNHMDDYAFNRWEMGYGAAIAVVLLIMVYLFGMAARKLFGEKE